MAGLKSAEEVTFALEVAQTAPQLHERRNAALQISRYPDRVVAEGAILTLLSKPQPEPICHAVMPALRQFGTEKSLGALEKICETYPRACLAHEAQVAIGQIQARAGAAQRPQEAGL